jgi:heme-degrading monooxygenase HmoA
MTNLDPEAGYVVVINNFDVAPANADRLLETLAEGTRQRIRMLPGFISANFHVAKDRTRVINYAQWRSEADVDAMLKDPQAREHLKKAGEIATIVAPTYCDLRQTFDAVIVAI